MRTLFSENECYRDNFEVSFDTAEEQYKFLLDIENNSRWFRVPTRDLQVSFAECPYNDSEEMQDTRTTGTKLAIKAEGVTYPLGATAMPTLYSRAGISGAVLRQLDENTLSEILTKCFPVRKGEALLLLENGKIRACHGGDKSDYAILPMRHLYNATRQELETFDSTTYMGGYWNHSYMSAKWSIEDNKIKKAYTELYDEMFIPVDEDSIKTVISLGTSDTASSGATLWYTVESNSMGEKNYLVLGASAKLNHKNSASIDDFKGILKETFASYRQAFDDINKLKDIEITYPVGCIIRMCKKADLPQSLYMKAAAEYEASIGNEPTNALNVYLFGINGVLSQAEKAGASTRDMVMYTEKVARCTQISFKKFDIPSEIK